MLGRDPLICGFFKVKVFNLVTKDSDKLGKNNTDKYEIGAILSNHCKELNTYFNTNTFEITKEFYRRCYSVIAEILRSLRRANAEKFKIILEAFNDESWEKLSLDGKKKHSLNECRGCLEDQKFKNGLAQFPIKAKPFIAKARKYGLIKKQPLKDITNISENKKEEIIKRNVVRQIENIKKKTTVAR